MFQLHKNDKYNITVMWQVPEWTVQKIRRNSHQGSSYHYGRYFIVIHDETWDTFELKSKTIICQVNSILDSSGKIVVTIGKRVRFDCISMTVKSADVYETGVAGLFENTTTNALVFPADFIKTYGVRKGEFIDLVVLGVAKSVHESLDVQEEIYPLRFLVSRLDIQPSGQTSITTNAHFADPLVGNVLTGQFYQELVDEINRSFVYEMHRTTSILMRTLFENLIRDLLSYRFGPARLELYYIKERRQHLEYSKLLDNLKSVSNEFTAYTMAIDDDFFKFLDKYRENGNANVHILEKFQDKEALEKDKERINHYIGLISNTIEKIKSTPKT